MIIDQLILHDFGQFRGRNAITLTPPSPEQPVILFGGLNGAGKTTLLDAVQLCLFGPLARCSNREGMSYESYLLQSIHRGAGINEAGVELNFRHMTNGREDHYLVRRLWKRTAKGCREQLEVIRNHRFDTVATNNWGEQVEEFLPARIAHLFLFDGEKVEGYADPRSSAGLIETAVYSLLGLDLVEKLNADLTVVERRRRLEAQDDTDRSALIAAERLRDETAERFEQAHQLVAQHAARLGRIKDQREAAEERYRREGGHLAERRGTIEESHRNAQLALHRVEREMRDAAAGAMPLLLIRSLFDRMAEQHHRESAAQSALRTADLLEQRDRDLLAAARDAKASKTVMTELAKFLLEDREARRRNVTPVIHALPEAGQIALAALIDGELDGARARVAPLLSAMHDARVTAEEARNWLASVPEADTLAALVSERDNLAQSESALAADHGAEAAELERLRRELERRVADVDRLIGAQAKLAHDRDDVARVLRHSGRVRDTLERFRQAMIQRHLSRIEALILDSFRQLLRKKALVTKLAIDPNSFQLELAGRDGEPLTPDRLSAGERQLLAISILWGLGRASGRPLPTIIDTPLGRLDSSHRRRLVAHYFPQSSHQVILLSTDEEINGSYLDALKPFVGRSYQLVFDETAGATRVEHGYFPKVAENVH